MIMGSKKEKPKWVKGQHGLKPQNGWRLKDKKSKVKNTKGKNSLMDMF